MNGLHDMNVPYGRKLTWGLILSTTYGIYRERFWALFRIGLPIALLTYLFKLLQGILVERLIGFLFPPGIEPIHGPSRWIFLTAIAFVTGAVYWSLNVLFFAGIAGTLINDQVEEGAVSDAYSPVRKRLPALLGRSLADLDCL